MRRNLNLWLLPVQALLLIAGVCAPAFAGIRVSPAAFCLQNAEIGKDLDLGLDIVIVNKSDKQNTFIVTPLKPNPEREKWLKGYDAIPDASWFYFKEDRISIAPKAEGKSRMHLKIPGDEKYYNQHWMVYVNVTGEKGGMFRAGVKCNYMFETKARADVKERPYGILGIVPSVVKVEGKKKKAGFRIYNNDKTDHTYKITSYIPEASSARQTISATAGYEWIKKNRWTRRWWVSPAEEKITLKPGEIKDITLNIRIPKGAECGDKGWESIVMVKPDKGLEGFVRVLIEPME